MSAQRPSKLLCRMTAAFAAAGIAFLLLGGALPHEHRDSASQAAHQAHACQIYKLQDNFSGTASIALPVVIAAAGFSLWTGSGVSAPKQHVHLLTPSVRAPPVLS